MPHALILKIGADANVNEIIVQYFSALVQLNQKLLKSEKKEIIESFVNQTYAEFIEIKNLQKIFYTKKDLIPLFNLIKFSVINPNYLRLIVIHDAEKLDTQTANSLLKLIEEPNLDTYILLLTHNYESILSTIKSRCLYFFINHKTGFFNNEKTFKNALIYGNYNHQEIAEFIEINNEKKIFAFANDFLKKQTQKNNEQFFYDAEKNFLSLSVVEMKLFCDMLIFLIYDQHDFKNNQLTSKLIQFKNNLFHSHNRLAYLYLLNLFQK